jgi:hypothetical protein
MSFYCWKCGKKIEYPVGSRVMNRDTCSRCDADLHACRGCQFHDPGKHNQCAEPRAEWVGDREAANYCDYFQPNLILMARGERPAPQGRTDDTKKKFASLFNPSS